MMAGVRCPRALLGAVAVGALLGGCDSCDKKKPRRSSEGITLDDQECSSDADCAIDNPCLLTRCEAGRCRSSLVEAGERCDNATVCDGIETCDGQGRCLASAPPALDDGNPCTTDSCDPAEGVRHEPVVVDDGDRCTEDSCDPRSGEVIHTPVDVDDGDDCTFDSCDPKSGPKHAKPEAFYTCDAGCGAGFHVSSRSPSAQCGRGLSSFCVPSCGESFYSCAVTCPTGYHSVSRAPSPGCKTSPSTFCQKNSGASFYTCDAKCPEGYEKRSEGASRQCGRDTPTQLFCMQR
jgi:hypothetical protein